MHSPPRVRIISLVGCPFSQDALHTLRGLVRQKRFASLQIHSIPYAQKEDAKKKYACTTFPAIDIMTASGPARRIGGYDDLIRYMKKNPAHEPPQKAIPITRYLKHCPENCIPPVSIRAGHHVKVATTENERIWVEVTAVGKNRIEGVTDIVLRRDRLPFGNHARVSFNPHGRLYAVFLKRPAGQR